MNNSRIPIVPITMMAVDNGAWGQQMLTEKGIYTAQGLNFSVAALGKSLRWLDNRGRIRLTPELPAAQPPGNNVGSLVGDGGAAAAGVLGRAGGTR